MIVLSRQRDESIMIGDNVEITIVDIRGDKVRLGVTGPKHLSVHRREIYNAISREKKYKEISQIETEKPMRGYERELYEHLINGTLTWLKDYPNEREDFRIALKCYEEKLFADVIKNCYTAVEGITRAFLGNDKTLDNNKDELLKNIDLTSGWKAIIANYINYAHDFRHASKERHRITKKEAEGYLYMTGLIISLLIQTK